MKSYRIILICLFFLLGTEAFARDNTVALTKEQAAKKIERINYAREQLIALAETPPPKGLEEKETRRYERQQALVEVAASNLKIAAMKLKLKMRRLEGANATTPFTLDVSAAEILGDDSTQPASIKKLNQDATQIIANINSSDPLPQRTKSATEETLNKEQANEKIQRLELASKQLLALAEQPAPKGLSGAEQRGYIQHQLRTKLMANKLQRQIITLKREIRSQKDPNAGIPFELSVSKSRINATGERSKTTAIKELYRSIGQIIDTI